MATDSVVKCVAAVGTSVYFSLVQGLWDYILYLRLLTVAPAGLDGHILYPWPQIRSRVHILRNLQPRMHCWRPLQM